jgi:hypothetical protein
MVYRSKFSFVRKELWNLSHCSLRVGVQPVRAAIEDHHGIHHSIVSWHWEVCADGQMHCRNSQAFDNLMLLRESLMSGPPDRDTQSFFRSGIRLNLQESLHGCSVSVAVFCSNSDEFRQSIHVHSLIPSTMIQLCRVGQSRTIFDSGLISHPQGLHARETDVFSLSNQNRKKGHIQWNCSDLSAAIRTRQRTSSNDKCSFTTVCINAMDS